MLAKIYDMITTYLQDFCINIVKCGAIPQHVAFIMDGNRRYARKLQAPTKVGHYHGFDILENVAN